MNKRTPASPMGKAAAPHPTVTLADMSNYDDDRPTPEGLEQLARSLAMDGSLGRRDARRVAVTSPPADRLGAARNSGPLG